MRERIQVVQCVIIILRSFIVINVIIVHYHPFTCKYETYKIAKESENERERKCVSFPYYYYYFRLQCHCRYVYIGGIIPIFQLRKTIHQCFVTNGLLFAFNTPSPPRPCDVCVCVCAWRRLTILP